MMRLSWGVCGVEDCVETRGEHTVEQVEDRDWRAGETRSTKVEKW